MEPATTPKLIPIARPLLGAEETAAVQAVLESGELAQGRQVAEFEAAFATFCGARYAVATSSGTTALHLALLAHGIGPGDEVITTSFTFVATGCAVLYVGATPVFADIEPDTFNLDVRCVERLITPRTRAVLPVDLYGQPADLPRLASLCSAYGLALIDDASQAHGAEIGGKRTGSFGTACFSFYPTKNMTTGEGGLITTDRLDVAETARHLRQHGARERYVHDVLGFNYRMTNIQAAIGLVQLGRLPGFNDRRAANAAYLDEHLRGVKRAPTRAGVRHVFHQYTVRIARDRDQFSDALLSRGVESRVYYPLALHQQPLFKERGLGAVVLPEAERATKEILSLPVHPGITDEQLAHIVQAVSEIDPVPA